MQESKYIIDSISKKLSKTEIKTEDFLKDIGRGVYTTLRIISDNQIMLFEAHVNRLVHSFNNIKSKGNDSLTKDEVKKTVLSLFRLSKSTLKEFSESKVSITVNEKKIKEQFSIVFRVLIEKFHPKNIENVSVDVMKGSRKVFGSVKDLKWVHERKRMMDEKQDFTEEVLLLEEDEAILEGLSSNFYVIKKNGDVETPNENILFGSMRTLALEICNELKIKVVLTEPNFKEIDEWEEVFISSTSRFVLPIHNLYIDKKLIKKFTPKVSKKIRDCLIAKIKKNTTKF